MHSPTQGRRCDAHGGGASPTRSAPVVPAPAQFPSCSAARTGRRRPPPDGALRSTRPGRDHVDRLYRAAWARLRLGARTPKTSSRKPTRACSPARACSGEDDLGYLLRALRNTFLNQKRSERRRLRPRPLPDQLDLVLDLQAREPQAVLEAGEPATPRSPRSPTISATSSWPWTSQASPTEKRQSPAHPRGDGDEPPLPRPSTVVRHPRRRLGLIRSLPGRSSGLSGLR